MRTVNTNQGHDFVQLYWPPLHTHCSTTLRFPSLSDLKSIAAASISPQSKPTKFSSEDFALAGPLTSVLDNEDVGSYDVDRGTCDYVDDFAKLLVEY